MTNSGQEAHIQAGGNSPVHDLSEKDIQKLLAAYDPLREVGKLTNLIEGTKNRYSSDIIEIVQSIESRLETLAQLSSNLGDELFFHCTRMLKLASEIQSEVNKSEKEKNATVREFWNLLKVTPKIMADEMGIEMEAFAKHKLNGKPNYFILIMDDLNIAQSKIQEVMEFTPLFKDVVTYDSDYFRHSISPLLMWTWRIAPTLVLLGAVATAFLNEDMEYVEMGRVRGAPNDVPCNLVGFIAFCTLFSSIDHKKKTKQIEVTEPNYLAQFIELTEAEEEKALTQQR